MNTNNIQLAQNARDSFYKVLMTKYNVKKADSNLTEIITEYEDEIRSYLELEVINLERGFVA